MLRRHLLGTAAVVAASAAGGGAWAQSGQIRLVVPYAPGGSTDTAARVLAERMSADLGQTVIVENRPGGGTMVGMQNVASAKPDGSSLLLMTTTAALLPAFDMKMPIDPQKDLVTVSQLADIPVLFAVATTHPATTLKEFEAWLKTQKPPVPFATSSTGALPHLWGELLNLRLGRLMEHVPYKGAADALRDVLAGHVPAFMDTTTPIDQQIRAGKMRGLIVGAPERVPATPDVPTAAELGMKDLEAAVYFGVATTAGTPAPLIAKYNAAINAALKQPAVRERLSTLGFIPTGGTPEAYAERLRTETTRWRAVIKEAGIKPPV